MFKCTLSLQMGTIWPSHSVKQGCTSHQCKYSSLRYKELKSLVSLLMKPSLKCKKSSENLNTVTPFKSSEVNGHLLLFSR